MGLNSGAAFRIGASLLLLQSTCGRECYGVRSHSRSVCALETAIPKLETLAPATCYPSLEECCKETLEPSACMRRGSISNRMVSIWNCSDVVSRGRGWTNAQCRAICDLATDDDRANYAAHCYEIGAGSVCLGRFSFGRQHPPNNAIGGTRATATIADCQTLCQAEDLCAYFTWDSGGVCSLKSAEMMERAYDIDMDDTSSWDDSWCSLAAANEACREGRCLECRGSKVCAWRHGSQVSGPRLCQNNAVPDWCRILDVFVPPEPTAPPPETTTPPPETTTSSLEMTYPPKTEEGDETFWTEDEGIPPTDEADVTSPSSLPTSTTTETEPLGPPEEEEKGVAVIGATVAIGAVLAGAIAVYLVTKARSREPEQLDTHFFQTQLTDIEEDVARRQNVQEEEDWEGRNPSDIDLLTPVDHMSPNLTPH